MRRRRRGRRIFRRWCGGFRLQQAAEMTIVENLQREDLSALEQAEAFAC